MKKNTEGKGKDVGVILCIHVLLLATLTLLIVWVFFIQNADSVLNHSIFPREGGQSLFTSALQN